MSFHFVKSTLEPDEPIKRPFQLIWHGGEPLTCGVEHFEKLICAFQEGRCKKYITHCVQTNATLINEDWISLFKKYNVNVGVSIDGDFELTKNRKFPNGKSAYDSIIFGIELLRQAGVPFSAICVISKDSLDKAGRIYKFFQELKPVSLGFNIEEKEGVNSGIDAAEDEVKEFWCDLATVWKKEPNISIREFNSLLPMMHGLNQDYKKFSGQKVIDIFPSMSLNGDIVLLSPEFVGGKSKEYNDFFVGNINECSLTDMLNSINQVPYVTDYLKGVASCRDQCDYFELCGGGQASNKFYENGAVNSTETMYCRNTVKCLVDGLLEALQEAYMRTFLGSPVQKKLTAKRDSIATAMKNIKSSCSCSSTGWSKIWNENIPGPWQQTWNNWTQMPSFKSR